ncbi:MAG: ribosomal protein L7/L12 [Sphingobium sp.]
MYIPTPWLIGVVIVLALIFIALWRRGSDDARRRNELMGIDSDHFSRGVPSAPALAALTPEIEAEIRRLIGARRKIDAIKLARETTGMGLKDAKDYVEGL